MATHQTDFPYEEIRQAGGDYFDSYKDALLEANGIAAHVWSVVATDTDEGTSFMYGPGHHYINVIGWFLTQETHDGNTYYEEAGANDHGH